MWHNYIPGVNCSEERKIPIIGQFLIIARSLMLYSFKPERQTRLAQCPIKAFFVEIPMKPNSVVN